MTNPRQKLNAESRQPRATRTRAAVPAEANSGGRRNMLADKVPRCMRLSFGACAKNQPEPVLTTPETPNSVQPNMIKLGRKYPQSRLDQNSILYLYRRKEKIER